MPRGSKWWRFRYRFQHAERMISLGVYPGVNLATARLLHADARGLLARDIDPSADRKERRAASAHTFEVIARQWLKLLQPRVAKGQLAADTVKDATRILERDIFPALGTRAISDIKAHELLMVLKQIELKGLRYTARRAKQRCSRVFRHAIGRNVSMTLRHLVS